MFFYTMKAIAIIQEKVCSQAFLRGELAGGGIV